MAGRNARVGLAECLLVVLAVGRIAKADMAPFAGLAECLKCIWLDRFTSTGGMHGFSDTKLMLGGAVLLGHFGIAND